MNTRENGFGFSQKYLADLGEFNTPSNPIKQLGVMPPLERRDRRAHRRLGQVQHFGGSSDVLPLGDRNKDPKLLKRHTLDHTIIPLRRTLPARTAVAF